jgi:gamma-glutamyl-gamma-aminobutyrate hydrolase PuuD
VVSAPDGVIEAVEHQTAPFYLGVQWHLENFWRTGEFRPLFDGFVLRQPRAPMAAPAYLKRNRESELGSP